MNVVATIPQLTMNLLQQQNIKIHKTDIIDNDSNDTVNELKYVKKDISKKD